MAKYIYQHRRASKDVLSNKETLIPQEGELIVEFDHENNLHRLKIGDGIHNYSELSYLMAGDEILTQALPDVMQVTLDVNEWKIDEDYAGEDSLCTCYRQEITVERATTKSRLDLQPDVDMLAEFQKLGIVLVTKNINSQIFVCSIGNKPTKTYKMQATLIVTDILDQQDKVLGIPIGASVSLDETNARVSALEEQIADMLYDPISLTSLDIEPKTKEIGEEVASVVLTWKLNRDPQKLTLNEEEIDVTLRQWESPDIDPPITHDNNQQTWTLVATGEKEGDVSEQETPKINFYYGVYYGALEDGALNSDDEEILSAAILGLTKKIQNSKNIEFDVSTSDPMWPTFALPSRYTEPTKFNIGGLDYEWEKVKTFNFTNDPGYTESYDVWQHTRMLTGNIKVKVL